MEQESLESISDKYKIILEQFEEEKKIGALKVEEILSKKATLKKQINKRRIYWLITAFIFIITIQIFKYFNEIVQNVHFVILIIASILLGFLLFWFREKFRLGYGTLELFIGMISIISVFSSINYDYNLLNSKLEIYVKLGGGLYIIVRGLDNVTKSLKGKRAGLWLKKHFNIGD